LSLLDRRTTAIIFNALIIIALVPLALRGVKYRPLNAASLLRRNLLIYGRRAKGAGSGKSRAARAADLPAPSSQEIGAFNPLAGLEFNCVGK
jgi:hypothetical protein